MSLSLKEIAAQYELLEEQIGGVRQAIQAELIQQAAEDSARALEARARLAAYAMTSLHKQYGNSEQFNRWMENTGGRPNTLNCWEGILYAGIMAGVCSIEQLRQLADTDGILDSQDAAEHIFQYTSGVPLRLNDAGVPTNVKTGDVLFILGTTHVVLALDSDGTICNHWNPMKSKKIMRLKDIIDVCYMDDEGWRISVLPSLISSREIPASSFADLKPPLYFCEDTEDAIREGIAISLASWKKALPLSTSRKNWLGRVWAHFAPPVQVGVNPTVRVCTPKWPGPQT